MSKYYLSTLYFQSEHKVEPCALEEIAIEAESLDDASAIAESRFGSLLGGAVYCETVVISAEHYRAPKESEAEFQAEARWA